MNGGTRVKICGITNLDDALAAIDCGADALGFVFYRRSPRAVDAEQVRAITCKLPPFVNKVGLFVNESAAVIRQTMAAAGLDTVQLHGDETPQQCLIDGYAVIKALRVKDAATLEQAAHYPGAILLDAWNAGAYGGTGERFDWQLIGRLGEARPLILAGGLTPLNVGEAIRTLRPYAVDVSSGVEREPGRKDHEKLREFFHQVRTA